MNNLRNQSVKSLLISIVGTTAALYIVQMASDFLLGGGLWLNVSWIIHTLITNVFVCIGMAMLVYQKGVRPGLSVGFALFIVATLPFILGIGPNSTALSYTLIGLVGYLLPGAILGMSRKS